MSTHAASAARPRLPDLGRLRELVLHLARREVDSLHRFTLLGWAWPLARQLAQLGVLVLVFSSVLDLGIDNFAAFVFSGLIAWNWFSTGVANATASLLTRRNLVFQPGFPTVVLPLVAVTVPFVDMLMALPVLVLLLGVDGDLHATLAFMPVLMAIQLVLMAGIAWIASAATVYLRDVQQIVIVGLTMLFYLTPVFYPFDRVPEDYRWVLRLNPLTTLVDGYHAVVVDGELPGATSLAVLAGVSALLAGLGYLLFRRLSGGFVDEL